MSYASVGTDTGGSIRIPSAACGIVGLKPSFGDISTDGVVPLSPTLDHVGPMTVDVGDARLLYQVMKGPTSQTMAPEVTVSRLRVGIPTGYFMALLDAEVAAAFSALCDPLRQAGVTIDEVTIAHAADLAGVYTHIASKKAAVSDIANSTQRPTWSAGGPPPGPPGSQSSPQSKGRTIRSLLTDASRCSQA